MQERPLFRLFGCIYSDKDIICLQFRLAFVKPHSFFISRAHHLLSVQIGLLQTTLRHSCERIILPLYPHDGVILYWHLV